VDDLYGEILKVAKRGERVLVTTLTKKMAEELTKYYQGLGVKATYLHSDIDTLERIIILEKLRKGEFDVLVGINLLREGLDLPEVSLVAIFDADKIGFLRSSTSLIQTIGRAARNVNGRVIMYADTITDSMRAAIGETERRRTLQAKYNADHGITPQSIIKQIDDVMSSVYERDYMTPSIVRDGSERFRTQAELDAHIATLQEEMRVAAANLDFERAAAIRDDIKRLRNPELGLPRRRGGSEAA
jgi:excinuclease ABC subunit B